MPADLPLAVLLAGLGRPYGQTDCVRLIADALAHVYGRLPPELRRDILIAHEDPTRPFSGPEALDRAGYGTLVDVPRPGAWHLVQRWTRLSAHGRIVPTVSKGHAWLWRDGLLIEATPVRRDWCRWAAWEEPLAVKGCVWRAVALYEPTAECAT